MVPPKFTVCAESKYMDNVYELGYKHATGAYLITFAEVALDGVFVKTRL